MSSSDYILGAVLQFDVDGAVRPVIFEAPEGEAIKLKELVVLNGPFELELIDGRIGDRLLPLDGPLDIAYFAKRPAFDVGTITPDENLTLYIRAFGSPSVGPYLNLHVVGTVEDWVAPEVTAERRTRVGEFTYVDFKNWLTQAHDDAVVQSELLRPLELYFRDPENIDAVKTCAAAQLLMAHARGHIDVIAVSKRLEDSKDEDAVQPGQVGQGGNVSVRGGNVPLLVHQTAVDPALRSPGAEAFRQQKTNYVSTGFDLTTLQKHITRNKKT